MIRTETITDTREGKPQLLSNIEAWKTVSDYLSTTLGPFGTDKMFVIKDKVLITNDGATILENKKFDHPAAKILKSISSNQDKIIGDGTTSVVLLASALLDKLKQLIKDDFPLNVITNTLEDMKEFCISELENLSLEFKDDLLYKVAETAVNSKILKHYKSHFAKIVVDGLNGNFENSIAIKKVLGGNIKDSFLVEGIAFEKCFTYAGYEQQPKKIDNPKVLCLNIELEWKSERDNAEIRINSVNEYKNVVDAEWQLITEKLNEIVLSGANVVLSKLPIGDFATQYFAKQNVFCAGRVHESDLIRVSKLTNSPITSTTSQLIVGECFSFEEIQIGKLRFNLLKGDFSNTIILRGPGEIILDEIERSIHDAIMVVKNTFKTKLLVCGGGSVEMQLSNLIRSKSYSFTDKRLFVGTCIAQALEIIPFTLADNFGLDAMACLQLLRKKHSLKEFKYGVDSSKLISDMAISGIVEPMEVKKSMIRAAFAATKAIIGIDMTIVKRKSEVD